MTADAGLRDAEMLEAVRQVVVDEIRPALSVHAGSIEVRTVEDGIVHLAMLASCGSCYFRRGCAGNLVEPTLRGRLGGSYAYVVDNARVRRVSDVA